MNRYTDLLETLLSYKDEFEWLNFKENWFSKDEIGEYISAIANEAAPDYAQELTFERLFMYYGAKGLTLRKDTFEKTLKLKNKRCKTPQNISKFLHFGAFKQKTAMGSE